MPERIQLRRGHCGPCLMAWTEEVDACPECGEPSTEVLRALLVEAAVALCEVGKAALVVKPSLVKPYPDDGSWSPWTRFLEMPARTAYNLGSKIRRVSGVSR